MGWASNNPYATQTVDWTAEKQEHSMWEQKFAGHTLERDLATLMLPPTLEGLSQGDVMAAWRQKVKAMREAAPGADMDELKQCRDRLILALDKGGAERLNQISESTCKTCRGSGRFGVGFGQVCPTCKGTGQRNG